ncbi:unnamed protein product [Dibothriocephalus latus]|uniref:Uncharacterized protein n=1 Tax=Dibothriocephalus latus TaxID=60516 RepID=A0A3P7MWG9_DIBLA|nr:unnamed protein product [Dibothriocephalus latus]
MGTSVEPSDFRESENVTEAQGPTPVVSSMFATLTISAQLTEQKPELEDITTSTICMQIGLVGNLSTSSFEISHDIGPLVESTGVTSPESTEEAAILYSVPGTPTMPMHSTENSVSLQSDGATPSIVDERTETTGIVSAGPVKFSDATGSTVESIYTLIWVDANETISPPHWRHRETSDRDPSIQ